MPIHDPENRKRISKMIVNGHLTARETRELVRNAKDKPSSAYDDNGNKGPVNLRVSSSIF